MLTYRFPREPYRVVSNVPYSITTPLLRTLFAEQGWSLAVLMVQWEVARKRSGNGGGTLLNASWAPWYDITVVRRVPAHAFRPVPRVDSGVITVARRRHPLLPSADRRGYQRFVEAVFTGKGAGLAGILRPYLTRTQVRQWATANGGQDALLPKDLDADQWASLYRTVIDRRRELR
jgi:23S rRNA (adenine-N6)-dimethyltransferase